MITRSILAMTGCYIKTVDKYYYLSFPSFSLFVFLLLKLLLLLLLNMTSPLNDSTPHSSIVNIDDATINRNSDRPIIAREEKIPTKKQRVSDWMRLQWKEIFYEPKGVRLRHYFIVGWLGRIGFIAKGIVYAVMGGLCIRTA